MDTAVRHVGLSQLSALHTLPRMHQAFPTLTMVYLVLGLLQVPTRPEGEAEAMADFGFIFSASQLLCQPQS